MEESMNKDIYFSPCGFCRYFQIKKMSCCCCQEWDESDANRKINQMDKWCVTIFYQFISTLTALSNFGWRTEEDLREWKWMYAWLKEISRLKTATWFQFDMDGNLYWGYAWSQFDSDQIKADFLVHCYIACTFRNPSLEMPKNAF